MMDRRQGSSIPVPVLMVAYKAAVCLAGVTLAVLVGWFPLWRGALVFLALVLVAIGLVPHQQRARPEDLLSARFVATVSALNGLAIVVPLLGHPLFWHVVGVVCVGGVTHVLCRRWIYEPNREFHDEQ